MKITYLHQYFNTPDMRGGTRSYEFARRLVAQGHEVNLVTAWRHPEGTPRSGLEVIEGVNVHWIPSPYDNKMSYPKRIAAFADFALKARKLAASFDADVIFATSTPLTIAIPGVYAKKKRKLPMVFEVRDVWPEVPISVGALKNPFIIAVARWLERYAYRHADRIVALSPEMRDFVVKTDKTNTKVDVIPNSSDIDLFDRKKQSRDWLQTELPALKGKKVITYAGTIGVVNGVHHLANIAKDVAAQTDDIHFVVVGYGVQSEFVKSHAQSIGVLDKNFHMLPARPKKDMPKILASSDMMASFFIPEMSANSANKFFDALAASRPICINHEGFMADHLRETGAGPVLPFDKPLEAANILISWLGDDTKMKAAEKASFGLAQSHFSRDKLALELEAVLMETAGLSKP